MTDINKTIEDLGRSFEEFKSTHTQELNALKAGNSTADFQAKQEKINADIDRLQKEVEDAHTKIASAQMGAGTKALRDKEYTDSFNAHMRKGDVQAALNKGTADEGGYLTPVEWDRTITDKLREESPMRQLAQVQPTSKAGWKKLFNMGGTGSGWVGETDARPETATPVLAELGFGHGEIYANPAATQQLLDDAEINIEAWLASEVQPQGLAAGDRHQERPWRTGPDATPDHPAARAARWLEKLLVRTQVADHKVPAGQTAIQSRCSDLHQCDWLPYRGGGDRVAQPGRLGELRRSKARPCVRHCLWRPCRDRELFRAQGL